MFRIKTLETRQNKKGVYYTKGLLQESKWSAESCCTDWQECGTIYIYSDKDVVKLNRLYSIPKSSIKTLNTKMIANVKSVKLELNYAEYRSVDYVNKTVKNNVFNNCTKKIKHYPEGSITTYILKGIVIAESFRSGSRHSFKLYETYNNYFNRFIPEKTEEVDSFLDKNNVERLVDNEKDEEIIFL